MAQARLPRDRMVGMVRLMAYLPGQWMFVHIGHVIAQLKMNKMSGQHREQDQEIKENKNYKEK